MVEAKFITRKAAEPRATSRFSALRENRALITLYVLLVAVFAMGNGARDDIASLPLLRPLAVVCLGIGLYGMTRETWRAFRLPLGIMLAILVYILLHLIPLPPAIWMAIPGRELAVEAGEAVGTAQPWRPLSLVPYRGWNAFFAMLVPAAAMVLASQIAPRQHRGLVYLVIGFAILSAVWGVIQAVGGFRPSLYFYAVTNSGVPNGLFANRNHHAALLVMSFPMLALVASRAQGAGRRVWQIGSALLGMVLLLLTLATGSRGAIVFTLVSLAASVAIARSGPSAFQRRRGATRNFTLYFVAALGLVAIVCFAIITAQAESVDRLLASDSVEEGRPIVWSSLLALIPAYFPLGSGVGSFVEVFQISEPATLLALNYWNHAHNDWLEWALEGGIPAIALMAFVIAAFAFQTLRLLRQEHGGRFEYQLGLLGSAMILILGLWSAVDYPLRVPSLSCLAALAGIWMMLPKHGASKRSGEERDRAARE